MPDLYPELSQTDFQQLPKLAPADVVILKYALLKGDPRDMADGSLRWQDADYHFQFNHEYDEGTVYGVYVPSGVAAAWLVDDFTLDPDLENFPETGPWVRQTDTRPSPQ